MGAQDPEKIDVTATTTSVLQDDDVHSLGKTAGATNEETGLNATTTAVPDESRALIDQEGAVSKPDRNLNAAIWAITCGVALPCIPIIVITAILLFMVLGHQPILEDGWPELQRPVEHTVTHTDLTSRVQDFRHNAGPAYLVYNNPSTITTVASWTSRVIPYLSSSIMALVAFFAARRIATKSHKGDGSDLPSPKELTLLIELLGGKTLEPLKDTILHRWENKVALVDPIPLAFSALFIITMLGFLIPAVDTWFGIATTAAQIVFLPKNVPTSASFGRGLSPDRCPNGPSDFNGTDSEQWLACSLDYDNHGVGEIFASLTDGYESIRIMSEDSDTNFIANYTKARQPDSSTFYYLADKRRDSLVDFKAYTIAISTQCAPMTQQCLPGVDRSSYYEGTNFTCSPGFQANFTFSGASETADGDSSDTPGGQNSDSSLPATGLAFSPDAQFSERVGANVNSQVVLSSRDSSDPHSLVSINSSYSYLLPRNPLHFAAWSWGYPTNGSQTRVQKALFYDDQIYQNNYGKSLWILNCSTTVYDVHYTWVNGSIYTFEANVSSPDMGGLLSAPFAFSVDEAKFVLNSVAFAAGANNNSADLASTYAQRWSKAALALSIGAITPVNNILEQTRNLYTGPLARVPKIPLYTLLGLKAIYVFAVILLAVGAYCFTHPAETEVVKTQLSTKGLAAAHFDTPDILQQKVVKELQERLNAGQTSPVDTDDKDPKSGGLKRAVTLAEMPDKRVGVVARADGAWQFAVVANGVWNGIKPIAVDIIGMEAKAGNLGATGDLVNAWRK